jgi:hypothetical protein
MAVAAGTIAKKRFCGSFKVVTALPESQMPDHRGLLKKCLGELGLAPRREEEILLELGDHLEDHAAALEANGVTSNAAAQEALDSVSNWPELREEILAVETEEGIMNYRTKALWLPALCALTLSNVLLALIQVFGPAPHFYLFHTGKSMEIVGAFIAPWLITQPMVGAVAAYWSRRAGGTVRYQLLAALAPAIALLGLFLLILPAAIMVANHFAHNIQLKAFSVLIVTWVLLPAIPLLIGAAPFLRKPQPQS